MMKITRTQDLLAAALALATTGARAEDPNTRIGTLSFTHDFASGYPTKERREALRPGHARADPEQRTDRRPFLQTGPREERRLLGGPLRRPEGAGRLREELDSQRARQGVVPLLPPLRPHRSPLRPDVDSAGFREGEVN